jgi:putative Mn2+ efflux pump MntP
LVASLDYGYGLLRLLLIGIGLWMLVTAIRRLSDEVGAHAEPVSLRLVPMSLVAAAVLAFAVLLPVAGIIAATLTLILLSGAAAPDRRWHEIILLAIGITVFVVLVFVNALGLTLPLFPWDV